MKGLSHNLVTCNARGGQSVLGLINTLVPYMLGCHVQEVCSYGVNDIDPFQKRLLRYDPPAKRVVVTLRST